MNKEILKQWTVCALCPSALLMLLNLSVAQAASLCETNGLQEKILQDRSIMEMLNDSGDSATTESIKEMAKDAAQLVNQAAMPCGADNADITTASPYTASCRILTIRQLADQALPILRAQMSGDLPAFDRQVLLANQSCFEEASRQLDAGGDADLQEKMALQFSIAKQLASKVAEEITQTLQQKSLASIEEQVTEIVLGTLENGQRRENGLLFNDRLPQFEQAKAKLTSQENPCVDTDGKVEHLCAPKELSKEINRAESAMQDAGVSNITSRIARLADDSTTEPLSESEGCFSASGAQFNGNNAGEEWQSQVSAVCGQLKKGGVVTKKPEAIPEDWAFLEAFIKNYDPQGDTSRKVANLAFLQGCNEQECNPQGRHAQRQAAYEQAQQQVKKTQQTFEKGVCTLQRWHEIQPELWDLFDQDETGVTTRKANQYINHFTPEQCRKILESHHE